MSHTITNKKRGCPSSRFGLLGHPPFYGALFGLHNSVHRPVSLGVQGVAVNGGVCHHLAPGAVGVGVEVVAASDAVCVLDPLPSGHHSALRAVGGGIQIVPVSICIQEPSADHVAGLVKPEPVKCRLTKSKVGVGIFHSGPLVDTDGAVAGGKSPAVSLALRPVSSDHVGGQAGGSACSGL